MMSVNPHPARLRLVGALVSVLVLTVGACGSDGDEGGSATSTTSARPPGSGDGGPGDGEGEGEGEGPIPGGSGSGSEIPAPADVPVLEGREKDYADAMVASYDPERDQPFRREHVQCLANRWVPIVGVERFEDAGLEPPDLSGIGADMSALDIDEATATALVDAMPRCNVDLESLVLAPILTSATPDQLTCIESVLGPDDLRLTLINEFQGVEDAELDARFEAAAACLAG